MTKVYLDLKDIGGITNPYKYTAEELMLQSGGNFGNFAFRHALKSLINNLNEFNPVDYNELTELISRKENISQALVSCANWLCETDDYEKTNLVRANIIEKLDCDVISFGLGIQASSNKNLLRLGPNTIKLAKVLSERCKKLSVRDYFTVENLEHIGIKNSIATGCPSNFINLDPELGLKISMKTQKLIAKKVNWRDLKISFTESSRAHGRSDEVLKKILHLLSSSPSFYILQDLNLLSFILGEQDNLPEDYLNPFFGLDNLSNLIKSKTLYFSSVESWMDFTRSCDLSIGERIHGNMLALQSGTPSIVISHDTRTEGLSSIMGIPAFSPDEFIRITENKKPLSIYEFIFKKMITYDLRRHELAGTFGRYILDNNLTPCNDFLKNFKIS